MESIFTFSPELFNLMRDSRDLLLHDASYARYVAPHYDLGLELSNAYALTAEPVVVRTAVLGSAGVRVVLDAPTLRVSTSLLPGTGRAFSAMSAFGTF
jgi:hypothetical protein